MTAPAQTHPTLRRLDGIVAEASTALASLIEARRDLDTVVSGVRALAFGDDGNNPPTSAEDREAWASCVYGDVLDVLSRIRRAEVCLESVKEKAFGNEGAASIA